ncbi:MAG: hypothetical protein MJ218_01730 [Opitutales bacterium]|nr:hypothetical protein [Opitutales bacterium]
MASIELQEVLKTVMRCTWDTAHFLAPYCWRYRMELGIIALILLLVHWVRKYQKAHAPIRVCSKEGGEFFVNRTAILKLIRNNISQTGFGTAKRVLLKDTRRYVEVRLTVVLASGQSFEQASSVFQACVKSAIIGTLGESKPCRISIFLDKIEPARAKEESNNANGCQ